jgi:hypothetical protein
MAGYIGSKASVVSSGVERKKTYNITGSTTSLTGLNYTVGKVHVYQNGVRLLDGTDYTATNGTSITLTVAAQSGDNVVVVSQASFQLSESYTSTEADAEFVTKAGDSMTGNLSFGDNDKAIFGAGSDLEIYHDGSASYIEEKGTGSLYIKGTQLRMQATDGTTYLEANDGGALILKHNGATKFETTSTGIDVTGTVTGSTGIITGVNHGNFTPVTSGTTGARISANGNGMLRLASGGVDKMYVLDSGRVGIGTSSPSASLHISKSDDARLVLTDTGDSCTFMVRSDGANTSIGTDTAHPVRFMTNNSERMRIDSSGQVGIGTSSPAYKFEVSDGSRTAIINPNSSLDGIFIGTKESKPLVLGTGDAERMRIDSSGVVRIGGQTGTLKLGNDANYFADIEWEYNNNELAFSTNSGANFTFNSGGTERMRIDSNGGLALSYTGVPDGNQDAIYLRGDSGTRYFSRSSTASRHQLWFYNPNGAVGRISTSGSSTSFVTTSDYRLKENVVDLTGASARVNQLNPSRFNFIADADTTIDGFLAHEVADVVPEAISGTKDAMMDEEYEVTPAVEATYDEDGNELTAAVEAVMGTRSVPDYQGIDQSKLVPLLTAALQEALAEITSLKTRVQALEDV